MRIPRASRADAAAMYRVSRRVSHGWNEQQEVVGKPIKSTLDLRAS